jgi:hypothetical protein
MNSRRSDERASRLEQGISRPVPTCRPGDFIRGRQPPTSAFKASLASNAGSVSGIVSDCVDVQSGPPALQL